VARTLPKATYERITVRGPSVVRVKLTPMAERTVLPALLPEEVPIEWAVARPDRSRTCNTGPRSARVVERERAPSIKRAF
jgi:hypothetical protein